MRGELGVELCMFDCGGPGPSEQQGEVGRKGRRQGRGEGGKESKRKREAFFFFLREHTLFLFSMLFIN